MALVTGTEVAGGESPYLTPVLGPVNAFLVYWIENPALELALYIPVFLYDIFHYIPALASCPSRPVSRVVSSIVTPEVRISGNDTNS